MKARTLIIVSIICSLLFSSVLKTHAQYIFRHLDIVDGMSDNQIRSLSMAPDGRLGVRTASILNLYNGATFENFYQDKKLEYKWNYQGLPREYYDKKNRIWMKERDYLLLLDLKTNRFNYNISEELKSLGITKKLKNIFMDDSKNFWVITEDNTFSFYDISKKELVTITEGGGDFAKEYGIPRELTQYKNLCWIVYSSGLIRCWDYTSREFVSQDTYFLNVIDNSSDRLYIHTTTIGDIWLMHNDAVSFYNRTDKTWTEVASISGLSNFFTCMDLDPDGNIWVGTSRSGLRFIDHKTHKVDIIPGMKLDKEGVLVNDIHSVFVDNNNGVWVGTLFQGLCYYQPGMRKFELVQTVNSGTSLTNESIRSFLEEDDGTILIGTGNGVFRYHPYNQKVERVFDELSNDLCMTLYRDSKNRIWVGTFLSGLYCIDGRNIRNYKNPKLGVHSFPNQNCVRAIYEDSEGNFWISILGGVARFNPQSGNISMLYEKHPNVSFHKIDYNFFPSRDNTYAVVGESGIYYYNTKTDSLWISGMDEPNNPKFQDADIKYYCILNDSRSLEWFGTELGLKVWDNKRNKLYTISVDQGLPNNTVSAILEDDDGVIWISTANGICKIEIEDKSDHYTFSLVNFGISDGLQSGKFYYCSALKAKDGTLYFGGVHGFNLFNPRNIVYNKSVTKPIFTSFKLFNSLIKEGIEYNGHILLDQPINQKKEIILKHNENFITLEFSGLNYVNPSQTYFRFKLENFDQEWTEILTTGLGKVTYTGLRPGEYKLIVYTANNDKLWGNEPSEIKIVIESPFWVTSYAIAIYCILFIGFVSYLVLLFTKRNRKKLLEHQLKNERRQKEELDQLKFRFFTNISHEFRTPLTLILTPLETIIKQENDQRLKIKLGSIYRNAKDLLTLVNQFLDFRKLEMKGEVLKLSRVNIIESIQNNYLQFKDSVAAKNIDFIIEFETETILMNIDENKIHKAINNLLSNALKYTSEGGDIAIFVNLVFINDKQYAKISVTDTGRGINNNDIEKIFTRFYQSNDKKDDLVGTGIGLHLVKEYIELHGGKITAENKKEGGSIFTLFIPTDLKGEDLQEDSTIELNEDVDINIEKGKTLLIVEDNSEFRHFLVEQLYSMFNIIEAVDGEEGEKLAILKSPDLIISDLMMPKVDGITLCKSLKTNIRTSHIPIILLTARSSDEAKMEGYEAGADSYVAKPFNFEMLLTRVKKLIEQQEKRKDLFRKTIEITPSSITISSLDEGLVQNALKCVEKNMDNTEYSVEQLSLDIGLSRVHLYRKLQSITGQTPIDFIRSIRLKRAAQLLRDTQSNISEIADLVGFNTLKYFNKYFKEEFGMPPTQYRAEHNNMKRI